MKRLLAYLIIVISLGLVTNFNNWASANILSNTAWKIDKSNNYVIFLKDNECLYTSDVNSFINKGSYEETSCYYITTRGTNKFILKLGIDKYEIKVKKNKFNSSNL
jgi:hypothetical protein